MSRGERLVARVLDEHGIRYLYEQPVAVTVHGRVCILYPDFYLPDHHAVLEYAGIKDSPEYDRRLQWKVGQYRDLGMRPLVLDADSFETPWPANLLSALEAGRTATKGNDLRMSSGYSLRQK